MPIRLSHACSHSPADMPPYMLGQAIVATVLVVITLLFVFDRPPTPPSAETELQWKVRTTIIEDTRAAEGAACRTPPFA